MSPQATGGGSRSLGGANNRYTTIDGAVNNVFAANGNRGYDIAPFSSRWQGQLGVRYTFN